MEDLELARACALYADDKKAENIRILDLRGLSPISDYFVLVHRPVHAATPRRAG
jgi:ribosome-associated protein